MEYYGNGRGNVHLQIGDKKYYFDSANGVLRLGQSSTSELAPDPVLKLLNNPEILAALYKGVRYIIELSGGAQYYKVMF